MNTKQAIRFVHKHGIVLQAARGPVPSLAAEIAGQSIRGSWWAHPKSQEIYRTTQAVCRHADVLVCKLVDGKITYVHRRLWPALVKLASRIPQERLAKVWDEHTAAGSHAARQIPFPDWVPADAFEEAHRLSVTEAERMLEAILRPH
jgi:hypothetical protein